MVGLRLTILTLLIVAVLMIFGIVAEAQERATLIGAHQSTALAVVRPVLPALSANMDRKADDLDPSQLLIWCKNDTAYRPNTWPQKYLDGEYVDLYVIFPDGSKAFIARSGKVVPLQGRIVGTIWQADLTNPDPWKACNKTDQVLAIF